MKPERGASRTPHGAPCKNRLLREKPSSGLRQHTPEDQAFEPTERTRTPEPDLLMGHVSRFDRFLSRATVFLALGVLVFVFAVPALVWLGVLGFSWVSWDFSALPVWMQITLGGCIILFLVFEAGLLLRPGKKLSPKPQHPGNAGGGSRLS